MNTTWADVRPGTLITVKHICRTRPFKMVVARVENISTREGGYAFVYGQRLRMDGTRSSVRANENHGQRRELVHLGDIVGQAWDLEALQAEAAAEHARRNPRRHNANGLRRRGNSNGNQRGGSAARKARKLWLLKEFGNGEAAPCAFNCDTLVTLETITVDRFPLPGCQGGTYARGNIRPACAPCNSRHGAVLRGGALVSA